MTMPDKYEDARARGIADWEASWVREKLAAHNGNVSKVARECHIDRVYLHRLIRRHGIRPAEFRTGRET